MNISPSFPPPLSSTPFVSAGTDKAVACDVQVNNTSHTPRALTHLQTFCLSVTRSCLSKNRSNRQRQHSGKVR